MVSRISLATDFGLALVAPAPRADLAAPVLAKALGLSPQEAYRRLETGPGALASGLSQARARKAATLLTLLGLQVTVSPDEVEPVPHVPLFDVALQVSDTEVRETVARRLSVLLDRSPDAVEAGFARPGGLILHGNDWAALNHLRKKVRNIAGLQMLVSDPAAATYDILPWDRPAAPSRLAPMLRFLRRLGLGTCPLTGAVAAGVEDAMARLILRRFPDCGLVAVNRDFQRFDLVLAGMPLPVRHELASFLSARTSLPPSAFGRPDRMAGLRIECALSRSDALAFQADYAAIGLETRLRLVLERGDGPD